MNAEYAGRIPVKLSKEELISLSQVKPWKAIFHIAMEWIAIIVMIAISIFVHNPFFYILAVAFIGARQHALLILMHDGTHYRLFNNRKLNDWVAELFLAWPCFTSAQFYRQNHFPHHKYLNTADDPDMKRRMGDPAWVFPMTRTKLTKLLTFDFVGINTMALVKLIFKLSSNADKPPLGFTLIRYSFYSILFCMLYSLGLLEVFLLYWIVPLFTWLVMIMRIRSIAEHFSIPEKNSWIYAQTRTTFAGIISKIFLAPKNVNYHLEHHLYPSVPFYRLPELHKILMTKPEFADAHFSKNYMEVMREASV